MDEALAKRFEHRAYHAIEAMAASLTPETFIISDQKLTSPHLSGGAFVFSDQYGETPFGYVDVEDLLRMHIDEMSLAAPVPQIGRSYLYRVN